MTFASLCSTCCVLTRSIVSIFHTVRVIIFLVPGSCIIKNPNVAFQGVCTFVLIFDICRETKLPRIYYQRELFFLNTYANTSLFFSFQTMVWGWGGVKNVSTSELHILMCSAKHEKEKSVRKSRSPVLPTSCILEDSESESSETPVKAEAGRVTSRKSLFSHCLPPRKLLFLSISPFALSSRNTSKAKIGVL